MTTELTREQLLEMTETIAKACRWDALNDGMYVQILGTEDFLGNAEVFLPHTNWNDFHRACETLGVELIHHLTIGERRHSCKLWGDNACQVSEESDKQTAAFSALYFFSLWRLGELE